MSAIVAGKCKKCGVEFWHSLGHPKWYEDGVKRLKTESAKFRVFMAWKASGLCGACMLESVTKAFEKGKRATD